MSPSTVRATVKSGDHDREIIVNSASDHPLSLISSFRTDTDVLYTGAPEDVS